MSVSVADPSGVGAAPGPLRRALSGFHLLLAAVIAVAVVAQVYLIGLYLFGAGSGALDAHRQVGWSAHTAELVLLVAALAARLPRRDTLLSLALVVVGTAQVVLASEAKWLGALHPLLALFVLGAAGALASRGIARHRAWARGAAAAA